MKKTILTGFISELALATLALACLIMAAVFGKVALIVASVFVMLSLMYIAGGFYMEHVTPGFKYFNWAVWFWSVFCVEWTWNIFCKEWTWNTFCKAWTWNTFCKKWTWNTFCKEWVFETFCKKWIWQAFCINTVYKLFTDKKQNNESTSEEK